MFHDLTTIANDSYFRYDDDQIMNDTYNGVNNLLTIYNLLIYVFM